MKSRRPVVGVHIKTGATRHYDDFSLCTVDKLDPRLIKACANGRRRHYGGYVWSWL